MEGREGVSSSGGVTVVGSDAPSEYHVAPRPENQAEEVRAGRVGDDGAVAEADIFVGAVAGDRLLLGASQARPGAGGRVGRQAQL